MRSACAASSTILFEWLLQTVEAGAVKDQRLRRALALDLISRELVRQRQRIRSRTDLIQQRVDKAGFASIHLPSDEQAQGLGLQLGRLAVALGGFGDVRFQIFRRDAQAPAI